MTATFLGAPCKRGHSGERYQKNKSCVTCARLKASEWTSANRAKRAEIQSRHLAKNTAKVRGARVAAVRQWEKRNPHICAAKTRTRYAKQRQAMPPWVDVNEIRKVYEGCPSGFQVDHEIPLTHPLVCGLHVPWNLQYLPASENARKRNYVDLH